MPASDVFVTGWLPRADTHRLAALGTRRVLAPKDVDVIRVEDVSDVTRPSRAAARASTSSEEEEIHGRCDSDVCHRIDLAARFARSVALSGSAHGSGFALHRAPEGAVDAGRTLAVRFGARLGATSLALEGPTS